MTTTKDLMEQLGDGAITIDQAVLELREKTFPDVQPATSLADIDVTADPSVPKPDDLFWVGAAYMNGKIDDAEYEALSAAAADDEIADDTL